MGWGDESIKPASRAANVLLGGTAAHLRAVRGRQVGLRGKVPAPRPKFLVQFPEQHEPRGGQGLGDPAVGGPRDGSGVGGRQPLRHGLQRRALRKFIKRTKQSNFSIINGGHTCID